MHSRKKVSRRSEHEERGRHELYTSSTIFDTARFGAVERGRLHIFQIDVEKPRNCQVTTAAAAAQGAALGAPHTATYTTLGSRGYIIKPARTRHDRRILHEAAP
uniref:Uncharacterized protein n=1 Tax=Trichogramma kaykai TaxID=54128 RepID=A0ABD2VXK9_9HYME